MNRKIITFCVTILLLLTCSYTVFAEELDIVSSQLSEYIYYNETKE